MNAILVVDTDPILLKTLETLLKTPGHQIEVLAINNSHQAIAVIDHLPIEMVITGLNLPELDGFELIAHLSQKHPSLRIIVMTDNASPMFRAKIRQNPSAIHFNQDLDFELLTNRIFTELQIEYGGKIRGINLSTFLQMIEIEGRSCTLEVSSKDKIGYLYTKKGYLIDATYENISGKAAAIKILTWENVAISLDYSPTNRKSQISTNLMGLLIESRRVADENKSIGLSQRQHTRYDCLVAVEYDFNNWTYQCFLRDISIGGAYVETNQNIGVGNQIELTLSSPGQSSCPIRGNVVRRDKSGIGIQFEALNSEQKKVIISLVRSSQTVG